MPRLRSAIIGSIVVAIPVLWLLGPQTAMAAPVVPAGFEVQTIASGLNLPTALAFAPDGRIFIAQKSGAVRIVKNGALLIDPFIELPEIGRASCRERVCQYV